MVKVTVGKSAMQQAASTLAQYKVRGPITENEVRKALAMMVVAISEGQRFAIAQNNVNTVWAAGGTVSMGSIYSSAGGTFPTP
jgi:hypothetical protein